MHPLVKKHRDGEEITVADVCATITDLKELDSYQEGMIARKALNGPGAQAIALRRAELMAGRK